MKEYQPRKLSPGERVYIETSSNWAPNSYTPVSVESITPSGRINLKLNDAKWVFRADGRKLGSYYSNERIDWMPVSERSLLVAESNRVMAAAASLDDLLKLEPCRRNAERDSVNERINLIKERVAMAEAHLTPAPKESHAENDTARE